MEELKKAFAEFQVALAKVNESSEMVMDRLVDVLAHQDLTKDNRCYECTRDGDTCNSCKEKELEVESNRQIMEDKVYE